MNTSDLMMMEHNDYRNGITMRAGKKESILKKKEVIQLVNDVNDFDSRPTIYCGRPSSGPYYGSDEDSGSESESDEDSGSESYDDYNNFKDTSKYRKSFIAPSNIKTPRPEPDVKVFQLLMCIDKSHFKASINNNDLFGIVLATKNCFDLQEDVAKETLVYVLKSKKVFSIGLFKTAWEWNGNEKKPMTTKSIFKFAKEGNPEKFIEWKNLYMPESKTYSEEEIKVQLLKQIMQEVDKLDADLIRENNGIEFNDILMHYDNFEIVELATLLRQTIIRTENNGEPVYFIKSNYEQKYKRTLVQCIKYEVREIMSMKKYKIYIKYNNTSIELKLTDILDVIKPCINYRKVVNEPFGALEKNTSNNRQTFNVFPGFIHEYDSDFKVDHEIVKIWTEHVKHVLANDNDDVYFHLMYMFKHMLINPMDKTGTVVVIKGKQGSGKNSAFDIFYRFVVGPHASITTPNMNLILGRFNSIRQSLICCCLDEAIDNSDRAIMNKFKNLITADEVQIEQKGKEPYTVGDFCNYVVISNNDFASIIEESDRRGLCLETNNDRIGDSKYFKQYWETLANVDAGKHIFHWLINEIYIPTNWHPQNTPKTAYKQELKQAQASIPVKFLLRQYEKLVDNDNNEDECIFSNQELWEKFNNYCENTKNKSMSQNVFYKIISKYTESRIIKNRRCKVYSLAILTKLLKDYL